MEFNKEKCKKLTTAIKKNIIKHEKSLTKQKNVKQEKRLSVIISSKLSWLPHVKLLVVVPISKSSFCKEIVEHVTEILNFSVARPMLDLLLNMHLQTGISTTKMSSKRLKVFKEKQPDLY